MNRAIVLTILVLVATITYFGTLTHPNTSQNREVLGSEEVRASLTVRLQPEKTTREYKWYPVAQVVDGDTLVAKIEGKNVTIRLIGLDTPETVDPRKPVQCFGKEASAKAKQLLSGSMVRLESDPTQDTYDKYGRTLAYVYVVANSTPEGILVNNYMIAEGYGHEYTYNIPYKYQAEFKAAEKAAREAKKGLWADDACASESARGGKTSSAPPAAPAAGGAYECSKNVYNCSSFHSQADAQKAFDACGGSSNDVHKLDSDGDGKVCESLP